MRYQHGTVVCEGYLAVDETQPGPRPAVLIIHDWSGCNAFAREQADRFAKQGYVGFAIDMYGEGRCGETTEEKAALIAPLMADRALLLARVQAGLTALCADPRVDSTRIVVMGFCFGGLCALDLARSGAAVQGVVSFHGLLHPPEGVPAATMTAKVLIFHGFDDPMVTPEGLVAFSKEMTAAKVDWQAHVFGLTTHAFTNPVANDATLGLQYSAKATKRAMDILQLFLAELGA